ncbi:VlmB-like protein [Streptomyces sp. NBC_00878]|uniref:VlmB-like protein n=1 Tax=Streptomyces sp. NBC_00878 TaxID=2975854 RepID=UPI002254AAF9|nr:VlmB-like protein [Streptomyces sp. NBC_00878]MCX4903567.1 VlmB-like protein [Streptomyces sp. NBC_00878]
MTTFASKIPAEADRHRAPNLLEGALHTELTPEYCDLGYWFRAVPEGTLGGDPMGRSPDVPVPDHMLAEGPLRQAVMAELAFRSMAEEKATRAISFLVAYAPDLAGMDFYTTQLADEARHAYAFRGHLLELGVPYDQLEATMESLAGADRDAVLVPLEEFGLSVLENDRDYIGGVITLTVLVEGVLAPTAELSERKWRPFDPPAAEIERAAGIDEIRHLSVGSTIVRRHLRRHPEEADRIRELIARGMELWSRLPVQQLTFRRELLYQQGLEQHRDLAGDYELWPGRRLVDTTPEERMLTAAEWARTTQQARLADMGLTP